MKGRIEDKLNIVCAVSGSEFRSGVLEGWGVRGEGYQMGGVAERMGVIGEG